MSTRVTQLYGWLTIISARRRDLIWSALFSSILISIITVTLAFMWVAALPDGQSIQGYDAVMMVWYIAVAEAAVNGVDQRLMLRIGDDLQRGELTTELLRPVTLVWMLISRELGRSVARFALSLPACCIVAWTIVGPPPSWPALVLLLLVTGPLAAIVQTLLVIGASSSALWLGDTTAAWFVLQKIIFLFGGMLLPLEFWPGRVGEVLTLLPWASTAYIPAKLVVDLDVTHAAGLIGLQVMWIAVLGVAVSVLWRRGELRLMGATA